MDGGTGLSTTAPMVYYNRGRIYLPQFGRFLQRDPNATAMPLITAMSMNADTMSLWLGVFSAQGHFGDGMNLYLYQQANPFAHRDPTGMLTLGDCGSAIGTGMELYGAYNTGMSILGYFKQFKEGMSLRSIMIDAAFNIAANYAGGKLLDKLVDFAGPMNVRAGANVINKAGKIMRKHHVFPRFLRGEYGDILVGLSQEMHDRFHDMLYNRLAQNGIGMSRNSSTAEWQAMLKNPQNYETMLRVLTEVCEEFDELLGGPTLLPALLKQFAQDGIL